MRHLFIFVPHLYLQELPTNIHEKKIWTHEIPKIKKMAQWQLAHEKFRYKQIGLRKAKAFWVSYVYESSCINCACQCRRFG